MSRVLVLGHDTRAFLATIRSLWRAGHTVEVAGCGPNAAAAASRAIAVRHEALTPDAWLALLADEEFDLVMPCHDQEALALHGARQQITVPTTLPTATAFEVAFSKVATHELATKLGLQLPESRIITDLAEFPEWPGPLIVKPAASAVVGLHHRLPVYRAPDAGLARRQAAGLLHWGPAIVQRVVGGSGVGVELLANDGEVLTAFQHERVHEPPHGGGSSLRTSVALSPELLDCARQLAGALSWTGLAMVEFRVNHETGEHWFMEINGRPWGSLPLAVAAGMDFPAWQHDLVVDGRTAFPQGYKLGVRARNVRLDLAWHSANRAASPGPGILQRSRRQVVGDNILALSPREHFDEWDWRDPKPALREARAIARGAGRLVAQRLGRNNHPPARQPLPPIRAGDTVWMVCKGNICRSPFAAALAARLWPDVTVRSAGTYPVAGRPVPREGVAAAQVGWGLDLAHHRSSVLTRQDPAPGDRVLVFDPENVAAANEILGDRHVVELLGAGLEPADCVVADPWLGDEATFATCYHHIERALRAIPYESSS